MLPYYEQFFFSVISFAVIARTLSGIRRKSFFFFLINMFGNVMAQFMINVLIRGQTHKN